MSDLFRLSELQIARIEASKADRRTRIAYDNSLHRQWHKTENMFGRLKDWRRTTPDMTDAHVFTSATCITATVIFWLWSKSPEPGKNRFSGDTQVTGMLAIILFVVPLYHFLQ